MGLVAVESIKLNMILELLFLKIEARLFVCVGGERDSFTVKAVN